jgi:hypothetical protein
MTPASKPEKSEWMQIAESDNASSNVRKVDKRLTLGTLVSVGAIVIAGSLFANASDEPSAVADITSVATAAPATSSVAAPATTTDAKPAAATTAPTIKTPAIAQMPTRGGDDEGEEGEEHEGRERRGEDRDRYEGHEDGDDD